MDPVGGFECCDGIWCGTLHRKYILHPYSSVSASPIPDFVRAGGELFNGNDLKYDDFAP
jgi:hypothetical protein